MSGFAIFAVKDQLAHFRQARRGLGVDRIVRAAAPERVLVQLNPFAVDAAKNHRAEAAIADGQRLKPGRILPTTRRLVISRRLAIPQAKGFVGGG